jgi:hypothetical protein
MNWSPGLVRFLPLHGIVSRVSSELGVDAGSTSLLGPLLPTEHPPLGFPDTVGVAQVMSKEVCAFHLRIAARGRPCMPFVDVLLLKCGPSAYSSRSTAAPS